MSLSNINTPNSDRQRWGNFFVSEWTRILCDRSNFQNLAEVEEILAAQRGSVHPKQMILRHKNACPMMKLPDEILLLIMENIPYNHSNWMNIQLTSRRLYRLVDEHHLYYNIAALQYPAYNQLMERRWQYYRNRQVSTFLPLVAIYNMYRHDYPAIEHLQLMTGHSHQVCMSLNIFLKTVISEMPRAMVHENRASADANLERQRASLFKLRLARTLLSPDLLLLLQYVVEVVRQMIGKYPDPFRRWGWLPPGPPRDFSYFTLFQEALLRAHIPDLWDCRYLETGTLWTRFDQVDNLAKIFERQEFFLGLNADHIDDDLIWATMLVTHYSTGHALWSGLTDEEQKMFHDQPRIPSPVADEQEDQQQLGESSSSSQMINQSITVDSNDANSDGDDDDIAQTLPFHLENLHLHAHPNYLALPSSSRHVQPANTQAETAGHSRLDKINVIHNMMMKKIIERFSDKTYIKKTIGDFDLDALRDRLQKARKKIELLDAENCMKAISKEVKESDLAVWLFRPRPTS